jgi:hypothetical protein
MLNDSSIWWEAIYKENEETKTEVFYEEEPFYDRFVYIIYNIDSCAIAVSGSTMP